MLEARGTTPVVRRVFSPGNAVCLTGDSFFLACSVAQTHDDTFLKLLACICSSDSQVDQALL